MSLDVDVQFRMANDGKLYPKRVSVDDWDAGNPQTATLPGAGVAIETPAEERAEFGLLSDLMAVVEQARAGNLPLEGDLDGDEADAAKAMGLELEKEHVGFQEMVSKLQAKGHSKASAQKIAAFVGRKKYGKPGMAAKAKAGECKP